MQYLQRYQWPITLVFVVSGFCLLSVLMTGELIQQNNLLAPAITLDLILVLPLIYFLSVRKTKVPNTTTIPVLILGVVLGSLLLPKENQGLLQSFKTWVLPFIELSILSIVVWKVRSVLIQLTQENRRQPDFFSALKKVTYNLLPKQVANVFATEIAVIYYGFFKWRKLKLGAGQYSYHHKSGTQALLGAFILIIAVETVALHILLNQWSTIAAWILTGLSLYTALQVFGFAKSLAFRPIEINKEKLALRYGILNELDIDKSNIVNVEISRKPLPQKPLNRKLSPFGELDSHNIIITLKEPQQMRGLYGYKKEVKVLAFFVDEPEDFIQIIGK